MKLQLGDRLTLLLLPLCGLLGLGVLNQWNGEDGGLETKSYEARPEPTPDLGGESAATPLDAYREISARPLFSKDRRPPAVTTETKTRVSAKLPFLLEGIVISGEIRTVLLKRKRGKEMERLREGEFLDGWLLEEVDSNQARFSRGSVSEILTLKNQPEAMKRQNSLVATHSKVG